MYESCDVTYIEASDLVCLIAYLDEYHIRVDYILKIKKLRLKVLLLLIVVIFCYLVIY